MARVEKIRQSVKSQFFSQDTTLFLKYLCRDEIHAGKILSTQDEKKDIFSVLFADVFLVSRTVPDAQKVSD